MLRDIKTMRYAKIITVLLTTDIIDKKSLITKIIGVISECIKAYIMKPRYEWLLAMNIMGMRICM